MDFIGSRKKLCSNFKLYDSSSGENLGMIIILFVFHFTRYLLFVAALISLQLKDLRIQVIQVIFYKECKFCSVCFNMGFGCITEIFAQFGARCLNNHVKGKATC